MSDFLRTHLDVLYIVTGCGVAVLLGALFMPRWLRGVAYSRRSSAHALNAREDPVWGDLSWHDEAFERALAEDDDPYATAPFAPDLSSDATIRKYQLQAWDSAGFPAVPRTVQTLTLTDFPGDTTAGVGLLAPETGPAAPPRGRHGVMAVRQAQGEEPSTDLPGVSAVRLPVGPGSEPPIDYGRAGEPDLTPEELDDIKARFLAAVERGDPPTILGEPWRLRYIRYVRQALVRIRTRWTLWRNPILPVAVTVPRAPQPPPCAGPDGDGEPDFTWHADDEPVLEGILHPSRPAEADYDYDTLIYLAELEAQFAAEHIALRAWSRELEGAAS